MIIFYNILVYVVLILVFPFLPLVWFFSEKRRSNLLQRFAIKTGFENLPAAPKRIWIQALSVGEVISALPLVKSLKTQHSSLDIIFTASTKTGFDMAEQLLLKEGDGLVDYLGYFPFDIKYCINKMQRQIRPDAVVIVETDLWPNFLHEMEKNKVPVVLINARMSKRSLKGYMMFQRFSSLFFSSLAVIMAQSPIDKKRFETLGIDKNKIMVSGNIKFDQPVPRMSKNDIEVIREKLHINGDSGVIIGGSTHEGEEKILLSVIENLKEKFPKLILILAPRDPKRALSLKSLCESYNLSAYSFSELDVPDSPLKNGEVVLVDQMGILAKMYAICDAAFIGGSMVPEGGHNPLEAAAFAKPILFGTDMSDFVTISHLLIERGGARQVETARDLEQMLLQILQDKDLQKFMGAENHGVFSSHSGAVQHIIEQMELLDIV